MKQTARDRISLEHNGNKTLVFSATALALMHE